MKPQIIAGILMTVCASNAMADYLFQDGFETGDKSHTENGFRWAESNAGSGDSMGVSSERAKTGNDALRFKFQAGGSGDDAWAEQRFTLGGQYSELWIKYDLYIPSNYYHRTQSATANNKGLVTLWSGAYGAAQSGQFLGFEQWPTGAGNSRITYHPGPGTNDMGHFNTGALFVDRSTDLGKWVEWIIQVKVASPANNDGIVRVWKRTEGLERQLVVDVNNLKNYMSSGNYFTDGYLLGWSNSGFDQDTYIYIDNVIISDEPIGMNPPKAPVFD